MRTDLDGVKSTITISLGTKNKLREEKGNLSYEEFINYLIRARNQIVHTRKNTIEFQKLERKKTIYRLDTSKFISNSPINYIIIFSHNKYNNSPNFWFDIKIDKIRDSSGRKISLDEFKKQPPFLEIFSADRKLSIQHKIYFDLLEFAIQKEIEPQYHHKGRFEDYYLWDKEFKILNLPKKSFEEDVMDKLNDFKSGVDVLL